MGGQQSSAKACCRCNDEWGAQSEDVVANRVAEVEDSDEEDETESEEPEPSEPSAAKQKRLRDAQMPRPPPAVATAAAAAAAAASAASAAPLRPFGEQFKVFLVKRGEIPLGIDVNHADKTTLMVVSINHDEGLVLEWNQMHPAARVQVGDRIMSVNGVTGSAHKMIEVCKVSNMLDFLVRRAC